MLLLHSLAILKLVQAQRYPVVRLERAHVDWLSKASFGPGYEPGSHTSGSFCILVSLDSLPKW